jgi:alpha-D-ribose 1-methylphosphonate 5-triphosphate synthase subunit PhnH
MFDQSTMNNAKQSARAFRAILDAMARPGKVLALPPLIEPLAPAHATSLTVLLTLADHLTNIHLDDALNLPAIEKALRFHTGAQLVRQQADADFAILDAGRAEDALLLWKRGTPEYPDQSATLIIQTPSLLRGEEVQFSGPGIQAATTVRIENIAPSFWKARAEANSVTPLGLDLLFVTQDAILGCPRSTRVSAGGV